MNQNIPKQIDDIHKTFANLKSAGDEMSHKITTATILLDRVYPLLKAYLNGIYDGGAYDETTYGVVVFREVQRFLGIKGAE